MTPLKDYIRYQFREIRREMIAAVEGLSDDECASFEPANHWPIAWILAHCVDNVDRFLYIHMAESSYVEGKEEITSISRNDPEPGQSFPGIESTLSHWHAVWDKVLTEYENLEEPQLQEKLFGQEPFVESALRVINHTHSHVASIWCIAGGKRRDEKFPVQQTWMPDE